MRQRRRFGAILWEESAGLEEAIRLVETYDDPNEAARRVAIACQTGERWAVVDLRTLRPIAEGAANRRTELASSPNTLSVK